MLWFEKWFNASAIVGGVGSVLFFASLWVLVATKVFPLAMSLLALCLLLAAFGLLGIAFRSGNHD